MLNISKKLFTAWNNAQVLYCHWKSNEHLLPGLDGQTDLDVLLSRDDKQAGEAILRNLEFLQVQSPLGSCYPDVYDWIGFDGDTGKLIHIHLHYGLVTGHKGMKEYSLHWTDLALRTRILNKEYGVYTMEPNLEIVTLYTRIGLKADFKSLIRCRFGKFHFSKDTLREIEWLKKRMDKEIVKKLLVNFYANKAMSVFEIMEKNKINSSDYMKLWKLTETNFRNKSRVKWFMRIREILYYLYQKKWVPVAKKLHPVIRKKVPISGNGIIIVFVGQDGSGKSTITKEIVKWLTWKIDATRFYFGSGEQFNPWQKKLRKVLRRYKDFPLLGEIYQLVTLQILSLWGKYIKRMMSQTEKYTKKGGIAILDRFPQMQFAGINDGPKIETRLASVKTGVIIKFIGRRLAKKEVRDIKSVWEHTPDAVFKLTLPVEESFRRKPMENKDLIIKKHAVIEKLQFENVPVYNIDATKDYSIEVLEIKKIIWRHLVKL